MATHKWKDIKNATMGPEAQERARLKTQAMLAEMHLADLRRARELTQEELAETLGIAQSEVSKVENRADVMLSTLRKYVHAAGGELEIVAHFPDGRDVRITQFSQMAAG
jgi:DNA-binding transcriptional regulator YiaG